MKITRVKGGAKEVNVAGGSKSTRETSDKPKDS